MPGIGADPIRVTFQFGAGGVVSEVDLTDTTSGVAYTLPAPFLFETGIHIFAL